MLTEGHVRRDAVYFSPGKDAPRKDIRSRLLNPGGNRHMIRASDGSEASGSRERGLYPVPSDAPAPRGRRAGDGRIVFPHQEGEFHE